MNANSKRLAPTIDEWLQSAAERLKAANIPSALLDAELILAHIFEQDRTWVIAHRDEPLTKRTKADSLLKKRLKRVPLAYLTGHREFYGRDFLVNEHVLIPRPETEVIIDEVRGLVDDRRVKILDVGSGSGAIAITLKLEMQNAEVTAVDISPEALEVTSTNAQLHHVKISTHQSDLLENVRGKYALIVANLPYVDPEWLRSPETEFEPSLALFADNEGLGLIEKLIAQSPAHLQSGGYLLLEADPVQHDGIITLGQAHGLRHIDTTDYIITLQLA